MGAIDFCIKSILLDDPIRLKNICSDLLDFLLFFER